MAANDPCVAVVERALGGRPARACERGRVHFHSPFCGLAAASVALSPAFADRRRGTAAFAAAISTSTTGFLFQHFGAHIGFLPLAVVGAAATGLVWVFLSETKPEKYED